jgi:hypothetical protein
MFIESRLLKMALQRSAMCLSLASRCATFRSYGAVPMFSRGSINIRSLRDEAKSRRL